jgi:hypothetical protein
MAYDQIVKKAANNSYIAEVMMRSSTTGMGLTGLAYGDVTYGYWREGAATGANGTCVTMSKGTYADHGWVEVDSTNLPGVYQFGVPDAALATGANAATVILKAAGAIDARLRIVLVDVDLRDSVRLGMTALPNAIPAANGGLPTTNGTKLNQTADLTAGQSIAVSDKTGFGLADDAITAAKFDESTAFPLKSADTGATAVARHSAADVWAVGTRTLTSFGTLVADIWANATRTLTAISDSSGVTTLLTRIVGTIAAGTHNAQSGDAYGVVANVTYGNSAIKTETALIYADTDELQKNQGNWATATGFATPTNVTDATSPLATSSQAETISQAIDALNDISTSDVQAIIDVIAGATWTDETLEAIKAAVDALEAGTAPTVEEIDTQLSSTHGSGAWGGALGSGAVSYQWPEADDPIVDDDGNPLDGVAVWITSDEAGATMVAGPQYTTASGYVTNDWLLDAGTYYAWVQLAGYNASGDNPTEITVS